MRNTARFRSVRDRGVAFVLLGVVAAVAAAAPAPARAAGAKGQTSAQLRARVPQFPPAVKAMGDKLKAIASPAARAWVGAHVTDVAKGPGEPESLARAAAQARWPRLRPGDSDALVFLLVFEAAENILTTIRRDLDSKSEMGEMESLRLQMAMDRVSKFMDTLSNILKKISDTDEGIVQNIK